MKIIANLIFLLVLIVNYSYARNIRGCSGTVDESVVDECLKLALADINRDNMNVEPTITNIVCKTRIDNGINIKLLFDLDQQRWECSFYKSYVETLRIQYEKCFQIENDNPPEESQSNNIQKEEQDDEAAIDALAQREREQEANNDQVNTENQEADENIHTIHQQDPDENQEGGEQAVENNEEIPSENATDGNENVEVNADQQEPEEEGDANGDQQFAENEINNNEQQQ